MWSEFLEDMKSTDTAVHLRSFSHLNPLDEYRLEGSESLLCEHCNSSQLGNILCPGRSESA